MASKRARIGDGRGAAGVKALRARAGGLGATATLEQCPVCSRHVPSVRLQTHVNECLDAPREGSQTRTTEAPGSLGRDAPRPRPGANSEDGPWLRTHAELIGHYTLDDFVSAEEEAALLAWLGAPDADAQSAPAWRLRNMNGWSYGKRWGVLTDLRRRTQAMPEHPMPHALRFVAERLRARARRVLGPDWLPTEANAIAYERARGHSLEPHVDDRSLSGQAICTLSLGGDAVMTFRRDVRAPAALPSEVRVPLPRRALCVMTRSCRYNYSHGIANADLPGDGRRVSITFRRGAFMPPGGAAAVWAQQPITASSSSRDDAVTTFL